LRRPFASRGNSRKTIQQTISAHGLESQSSAPKFVASTDLGEGGKFMFTKRLKRESHNWGVRQKSFPQKTPLLADWACDDLEEQKDERCEGKKKVG